MLYLDRTETPPKPNPTPVPGPITVAFWMHSDAPTHAHCTYCLPPDSAVWFNASTGPTKTLQKDGDVTPDGSRYVLNAELVWANGTPPVGTVVIHALVVDENDHDTIAPLWYVLPANTPKLAAAVQLYS